MSLQVKHITCKSTSSKLPQTCTSTSSGSESIVFSPSENRVMTTHSVVPVNSTSRWQSAKKLELDISHIKHYSHFAWNISVSRYDGIREYALEDDSGTRI